MVGGLFAFIMLSGRVAQPLVGLARLVQEYEEVNAAIGEAGAVLNRPLEIDAASGGLRPKCAISFQDVTFTYGGTGAATVNIAAVTGGHRARTGPSRIFSYLSSRSLWRTRSHAKAREAMEVYEELARADASVAWCVWNGNTHWMNNKAIESQCFDASGQPVLEEKGAGLQHSTTNP